MEADAALVRADRVVELHTISQVDLYFPFVVYPRHTEGENTFRFNQSFDDFSFLEFGMLVVHFFN